MAARGILRQILGGYLAARPETPQFGYGPRGKPFLESLDIETPGLQVFAPVEFNLSHSGELSLFAICRGRRVGIDLELIRSDGTEPELARRFLSPEEATAIAALPAESQPRAFFSCWTLREAYAKARGDGIAPGSASTAGPSAPPGHPGEEWNTTWTFRQLDLGPDFSGALVTEGSGCEVSCWT